MPCEVEFASCPKGHISSNDQSVKTLAYFVIPLVE